MELYHHGIKGQRWGVQNGPPYPLELGKQVYSIEKANKARGNAKRSLAEKARSGKYRKEFDEQYKEYYDLKDAKDYVAYINSREEYVDAKLTDDKWSNSIDTGSTIVESILASAAMGLLIAGTIMSMKGHKK